MEMVLGLVYGLLIGLIIGVILGGKVTRDTIEWARTRQEARRRVEEGRVQGWIR